MGEEILWIRGIYKTEMFIRAVIMSKSAGGGFPVATMNVAPSPFDSPPTCCIHPAT